MPGVKGQHRKSGAQKARGRAWQSMRIMRTFDVTQISATADISIDNARYYITRLEKNGYIVRVQNNVSGRAGSRIIYRLVRNTGPLPPVPWLDGRVYDPNIGQLFGGDDERLG